MILLEETILHGSAVKEAELKQALQHSQKKTLSRRDEREAQANQTSFIFGRISQASKAYWFKLIELYELIGNDDALKGIWRSMGDSDKVLLKDLEPDDPHGGLDDTKYWDTVELLKKA